MPQEVLQFAQFVTPVIALCALVLAIFSYFIARATSRFARENVQTAKSSLETAKSSLETAKSSLETAKENFERAGPVVFGSPKFFSRKEGNGLKLTLVNKGRAAVSVAEIRFRTRGPKDFRASHEGGTDLVAPQGPDPNHLLAPSTSAEWSLNTPSYQVYSFLMTQFNWVEVKLGNGERLIVDQPWEPYPEVGLPSE